MNGFVSVIDLFIDSVNRFPDRPALWLDGKFYTYQELYLRALAVATNLKNTDAERCVIINERKILTYVGIIAALLADKTYVPLDIFSSTESAWNLFQFIDTNLIIADPNSERVREFLKLADSALMVVSETSQKPVKINSFQNENAYLMFSSGSTGAPKAIMVKHVSVLKYIENIVLRSQPNETDKFTHLADITFDFSVHELFVPWSVGACVYAVSPASILFLAKIIRQHQLTFWASVPSVASFLNQTHQLSKNVFPSLRYSVFCGEPLSQNLAESWHLSAPRSVIDNLYGPTEAAVACTGFIWEKTSHAVVPIGHAFPEQSIKIHQEELCLRGPQVISSYWRNEKLSSERFFVCDDDGYTWYRTGDRVVWDEKVGLLYLGRLDDQIKIRGKIFEKLKIESSIRNLLAVDSVAIVPKMDDSLVKSLVLFVSHVGLSESEMKDIFQKHLDKDWIPSQIIFLENLPKNKNRKTDYSMLFGIVNKGSSLSSTCGGKGWGKEECSVESASFP